jgi:hypothetical protein
VRKDRLGERFADECIVHDYTVDLRGKVVDSRRRVTSGAFVDSDMNACVKDRRMDEAAVSSRLGCQEAAVEGFVAEYTYSVAASAPFTWTKISPPAEPRQQAVILWKAGPYSANDFKDS